VAPFLQGQTGKAADAPVSLKAVIEKSLISLTPDHRIAGVGVNTFMRKPRIAKILITALVGLLTFLVFLPALQNDFVNWDDNEYVYENPFIRTLDARFFRWAFFDFYAANWHPLTWISHAADYALWGLNPLGHHLTNNILHAINASLVVFLVIGLLEALKTRPRRKSEPGPLTSERGILVAGAATGLLFGIHPLHVESVAWVVERKDLLCGLFFLLSLLSYMSYIDDADKQKAGSVQFLNKRYLATLGFFALALLSKPMAVTLPVTLLILDWYPFQRTRSRKALRTLFIEKLPFFALSLASSVITILAQSSKKSLFSLETISFSTRVLVGAKALVLYLGKMIVPVHLFPLYPHPQNLSFSLQNLFPVLLVIGITIACVGAAKKQKLWLTVWCYYGITLLPVLGIIHVGNQAMADRYTYLPSLGPFLVMGLAAALLYEKGTASPWNLIVKPVAAAAAAGVLIVVSYITLQQIGVWKNSFTLWSSIIEKEPGKTFIAYINRGYAYNTAGLYDSAIEDFNEALTINPDSLEAYNNRGLAYNMKGSFDKAIGDFNRALAIDPNYDKAYNNRGISYNQKGLFHKAIEDFSKALVINPFYDKAYYNRALAYFNSGNTMLALSDLRKGCDLGNEYICNALHSFSRN
jgi:tetratricopeptide (TPR) repeat protein